MMQAYGEGFDILKERQYRRPAASIVSI